MPENLNMKYNIGLPKRWFGMIKATSYKQYLSFGINAITCHLAEAGPAFQIIWTMWLGKNFRLVSTKTEH